MQYESVLWYTQNSLIQEYSKKYFQRLLHLIQNSAVDISWIDFILSIDSKKQEKFLLHPDISSLIQDISNPSSRKKLEEQLLFFQNEEIDKLTQNKGSSILWTNIKLTLKDDNPQNMQVGHPDHDKDGMLWWWNKTQEEWWDVFAGAFKILYDVDREYFNEINSIIYKIVPMKTSVDVHNSCSYKECVGTLYLWYTTNSQHPEMNILEALIHESSHNKLNLIMQSEKLTINDSSLLYYSPYRPDARHIHGVLLWVHAIIPTVYVMLQAIEKWLVDDLMWMEKVILYHIKNKLWYRVLARQAKFTLIGQKIYDDMWSVMALCDTIIKNSPRLKQVDLSGIQMRAKEHFVEVKNNYPYLQY